MNPVKSRIATLPSFQLEDYFAITRSLVLAAWCAIAFAALTQFWIRSSELMEWPSFGQFPLQYNLLLAEFSLTSTMLTVLLFRREWLERTPRESLRKIRMLMATIIVWGGIHLLAGFHVSGSLNGPLILALPVLICAAFALLPQHDARLTSLGLVLGHVAVIVLEQQAVITPTGQLADAFSLRDGGQPLAWLCMGGLVALMFAVGQLTRTRLDGAGPGVHGRHRIDAHTGLFSDEFLLTRLQSEQARARRNGDQALLLFIELDGFSEYAAKQGFDAGRSLLVRASQTLLGVIRPSLDTPARYAATTLAVLMPTAGADKAEDIAARIREVLTSHARRGEDPFRVVCGAAYSVAGNGSAQDMIKAAAEALRTARSDEKLFALVALDAKPGAD